MHRSYMFWSLTLLAIAFLTAVDSSKNKKPKCPPGQEHLDCGSSCNQTCDVSLDDMVCDRKCVPRCTCISEAPVWHNGRCIPRRGCPDEEEDEEEEEVRSETAKSFTPKCPTPQVYVKCGSACNMTCEDYPNESICSRDCVPRCECPSTMPIWYSGKCIKFEQCPEGPVGPILPSDFNCPEGQVYQFCGSECNHTCEHGEEGPGCPHICVQRCGCPEKKPIWHKGRCVEYKKCTEKEEVDERGDLDITKPTTKPDTKPSETTPKPGKTPPAIPRSLEKQIDDTLKNLLEAIAKLSPSS